MAAQPSKAIMGARQRAMLCGGNMGRIRNPAGTFKTLRVMGPGPGVPDPFRRPCPASIR